MWQFQRLRRLLLGIVLCTVLAVLVVLQQQVGQVPSYVFHHPYFRYDVATLEVADPQQTCLLPRIHPFDNSILRYLSEPKSLHCRVRQDSVTYIDSAGVLRFNTTELPKARHLSCRFRYVLRKPGTDDQVEYGPSTPLPPEGIAVNQHDFVQVSCTNFAGIVTYSTLHAHIRNVTTSPVSPSATSPPHRHELYNVVIFGLDSVSRLSFIRLLPRTYRYLTEDMGAVVFRGMTKVGDNTFPNLVAALTGKPASSKDLPVRSAGETFDGWPIIWRNFSSAGYATLYAEDFPKFALFNYLDNGFSKPPTDHYLRPFWLAIEESTLLKTSSHMCFGGTPKHQLQVQYLLDFVSEYRNTSHFAFSFLVELSHEYLDLVTVADDDFLRALRFLNEGGHLTRTLFVFMSDHGHRFDSLRDTLVGRIEERMPFFAMVIPQGLRSSQAHILPHLQDNIRRLITPFDFYHTLTDILALSTQGSPLGSAFSSTGRSLFGPIPANRTCQDVGIPEHYCTCEAEEPLDIDDQLAILAAQAVIHAMNALLMDHNHCAQLTLSDIRAAHLLQPNRNVAHNARLAYRAPGAKGMITKVRVVLVANPSGGIFEATLLKRDESDELEVLGDISRINRYQGQSSCIRHSILRKYCYCQK